MKKSITKKLALAIAVVIMAFGLAACGGGDEGPYSGTWTSTTMEMFGTEMSVADGLGSDITIEIKDNGKAKFKFDGASDGMDWEEAEEGVITLKHPDMDMTMTFDGDAAVLDFMGFNIYMER